MSEDLEKFLNTFKLAEEDFERTNLQWDELLAIRNDYMGITKELNLIARYIEEKLQGLNVVHSVRCRVKDPDHLIAKIVRKRIASPSRKITIENYRSMITDLVGIRAIHLFKEDWVYIHQFIEATWRLYETPTAYIRVGDAGPHIEEYKRYEFNIEPHPYGYRSIHYLVESKPSRDLYIAEIQVRTIFEEGWSEIDHTIKYPKSVADPLLDTFLDNFNILAGNSDQMGSFVRQLKADLLKGTKKLEMYEKLTEKHAGIIDTLKKRVAGTVGELNSKLRTVEKKLQELGSRGTDTKPFERVLDQTRGTVARFERELAYDPQKATELFERSVHELERLETLLGMMLENFDHAQDHHSGHITIATYRHCAVLFSENVRTLIKSETERDLAAQEHLPTHRESHLKAETAITAVRARSGFTKFLIGPRYADLQVLREVVETNEKNLQKLIITTQEIMDPATHFVIRTQVDLFAQQNAYLKSFIETEEKGAGLFGWVFRLFARR